MSLGLALTGKGRGAGAASAAFREATFLVEAGAAGRVAATAVVRDFAKEEALVLVGASAFRAAGLVLEADLIFAFFGVFFFTVHPRGQISPTDPDPMFKTRVTKLESRSIQF